MFEEFGWLIIGFIPYYHLAKTAIFVWMMSPAFKGATKLYDMVIKNFMITHKAWFEQIIAEITAAGKEAAAEGANIAKSEMSKPENMAKLAQAANEVQKAKDNMPGLDTK